MMSGMMSKGSGMMDANPVKPGAMSQGEQGSPDPGEVHKQIVGVLEQVKRVAEQNGLDWSSIVSEVEGKQMKASATLPKPPKAEMGMSSMGGM
jgi:hypothetical protein